jgi:NADPH:quinone reductase
MKAIRVHHFGEPEVMKLEEVPDPSPGADLVLVRIRAAGVNPVETYIRSGAYAIKPELPYTPGSDAAGEIEAAGANMCGWKRGDRVYISGAAKGFGAYAERTLCELSHVHRLPENVSFAQGAGVNVPYVTAYRALFQRAHAKRGETVLVHGATGGVGIAAVQLAAARGITVIGTGGSEQGRQLVRNQGATHVLDHGDRSYLDQLPDLTAGRGPDVILEMLANVNLQNDLTVLANFGRIAIIGNRGKIEIDPRLLMRNQGTIVGVMRGSAAEIAEAHAAISAGLANGSLRPIVGKELPLAEAPRAHHEVIEQKAYGKIVLVP